VKALYPDRHKVETHFKNGMFSFMLSLTSENLPATIDDNSPLKISYEYA
jgi:hypothetical protein